MFKPVTAVLSLTLCFTVATLAGQVPIEPQRGWIDGEKAAKAFEFAKDKNMPVVVMLAPETVRTSSCPKCKGGEIIGSCSVFMKERSLSGMMRILAQGETRRLDPVRKITGQVSASTSQPVIYIADQQGNVIGYFDRSVSNSTRDAIIGQARAILKWQSNIDRKMAVVDRYIKSGSFSSAMNVVNELIEQDQKLTVMVDAMNRGEQATKDDLENLAAGRFLDPKLTDQTKDKIEQRGEAIVAEARQLIDEGNLRKAHITLRRMVADGYDTPSVKEAAELMEQINQQKQAAAARN